MNRRWLLLLVPLLLLLLALLAWSRLGRGAAPATDATATVVRGDLNGTVQANGLVVAARTVQLSFGTSGIVASHAVEIGEEVVAGEPIMRLEAAPLQDQLEEARAALLATEAEQQTLAASAGEIEVAAAQAQAARLALRVAEAALDALPEAEQAESEEAVRVEQARIALRQAEATLRRLVERPSEAERSAAEAALTRAEVRLAQAERALSLATLTAPFTGTVTALLPSPGEQVSPSQIVARMADFGTLQVEAEVDEVDVGRVAAGQAVTVTIDAFPRRPVPGHVVSVDPAPRSDRAATVYRTVIALDEHDLPLRLQMNADVEIVVAEARGVLQLPLDAIRYSEAQPFVVVRQGAEELPREVTLGADDGRRVEIVVGVEEGEVVLLP